MERIEVDGLRIAYERAGAGSPLVLLHGYVGDGPTTWRHQVERLSRDYTVVAWDAPGAGGSADPPEDFGMAGYADALAGLLEGLGIERAHVGGLSFGGALALAFAARHPGRVRSLVLVSAYAGWGGSLPAEEAQRRLDQALELSGRGTAEFVAALLPSMFGLSAPEAATQGFAAAVADFHPAGFRAMARAAREDLRPALRTIAVPTLLLFGEHDVRAPRSVAEALAASIPGSRLVFVPDAGHVCTIEAPDAVSDAMLAFLSEVEAQDVEA